MNSVEGEGFMDNNHVEPIRRIGRKDDDRDPKQSGGIVVPALLWWAGVPLGVVILLWLLFFR
jgi:hypothetical protein